MESESKSFRVIISEQAMEMLLSHARFLAQVSEVAALELVEEFRVKFETLGIFPERNPWLSDPLLPVCKYRKLLLAKRYLLIYQVKGGKVFVDAVLDCRQDYVWLL